MWPVGLAPHSFTTRRWQKLNCTHEYGAPLSTACAIRSSPRTLAPSSSPSSSVSGAYDPNQALFLARKGRGRGRRAARDAPSMSRFCAVWAACWWHLYHDFICQRMPQVCTIVPLVSTYSSRSPLYLKLIRCRRKSCKNRSAGSSHMSIVHQAHSLFQPMSFRLQDGRIVMTL
ncbi:hypothetical protein F5148DRAFT_933188 [Russula earlei]|uniref:Uncharacterized protein n=1 Tax=Russula earlei TaxID=71964 RepID=A0ACC0U943_9AGAM|nr:hypothetical protein F5148DRAFT_933188 [Russula earlei]